MKAKQTTKDFKAVALRMNADLHATLRTTAFVRKMSMAGLVEEILSNWFKINKIKLVKHVNRH